MPTDTPTYYVTTPIYYVNDRPHIGHCYTTLIADVAARFMRLAGSNAFFLTGTDEHAEKVVDSAAKNQMTPLQWADRNAAAFEDAFNFIDASNDDFIRTSQKRHTEKVRDYIQQLIDSGDVELGEYEGWFDPSQEEYVTESVARDHDFNSPVTGKPLVKRTEENYFFRIKKYEQALLEAIETGRFKILPEARKNEVVGRIKDGLNDIPITRAIKSDDTSDWGITMPSDDNHRVYVWIDALFNYLSTIDTDERRAYWPATNHLIAKDILWFHAVIWPCLLMALDQQLPTGVYAHSFWIREGRKMSKSLGNFIDLPTMQAYADRFGVDAVRYYLLTQGPLGATDSDFAYSHFVEIYNAHLANGLGNAVSRVANMIAKYFEGSVPEPASTQHQDAANAFTNNQDVHQGLTAFSQAVSKTAGVSAAQQALTENNDLNDFVSTLQRDAIQTLVTSVDELISATRPFTLAKDDANLNQQGSVATILYHCAEALRIASITLAPIMPTVTQSALDALGSPIPENTQLITLTEWGTLTPGTKVTKGAALFPRADVNDPEPTASSAEATP